MRVQLSIACLMAATQAIELVAEASSYPAYLGLAQVSATDGCCCQATPCMPTCNNACEDEEKHDGHMDFDVDVTEDVFPLVMDIGDDIVEQAQLDNILTDLVGENESKDIINDIVEPIIDTVLLDSEIHVD